MQPCALLMPRLNAAPSSIV
uniref:Uncharacterized protein n=1 Tax=Arundo donax TaxID=35708 RepID=A0A0A9CGF8_ARUDO